MKGIYSLDMVKKPRPVAPSAAAFHPKKGVGGGGVLREIRLQEGRNATFHSAAPPPQPSSPQRRQGVTMRSVTRKKTRDEGRMESGNERRTERREFVREGKSKAVSKGGIFVAAVGPGGIMESVLFCFFGGGGLFSLK